MNFLKLRDGFRAAVFGASGGIGSAFVKALREDPRCAMIYTGSRAAHDDAAKTRAFAFDLNEEGAIAAAAEKISAEGEVDLILVATGVLHDESLKPEKTMRALGADALLRSFTLNAVGPALIAKHFLPLLPRERHSIFAALSARVGSISDNRSGGWHAYRASKAALNQIIRTCAIELAMKNKNAVCVTLHPGTVDTAMSKPFQVGVPAEKLFTPDYSAGQLLKVLSRLSPDDSGGFFAWDGHAVSF
jgi:NAD(P)-dependent dehydrogenase (short-subunit alcohol dehydrogenase family)